MIFKRFHKFALTYNQIEQIVCIFDVLSEGMGPSSEFSLNPENSPSGVVVPGDVFIYLFI